MNEDTMRRAVLDLVLWAEPEKLRRLWPFVDLCFPDETIGVHADEDYLIGHGKFLEAKRRRKKGRK